MKTKLLILVVMLQTAWIVATSLHQEYILNTGPSVLLETRPVDPRDLLRGDFVTLSYTISSVSNSLFDQVPNGYGQPVYVVLAPKDQFYEVVAAHLQHPRDVAPGQVIVKGHTENNSWNQNASTTRITYGIEKYYVSEGTGNPRGKLTVRAVISKSGQASIGEVFVDNVPYKEAMKNQ